LEFALFRVGKVPRGVPGFSADLEQAREGQNEEDSQFIVDLYEVFYCDEGPELQSGSLALRLYHMAIHHPLYILSGLAVRQLVPKRSWVEFKHLFVWGQCALPQRVPWKHPLAFICLICWSKARQGKLHIDSAAWSVGPTSHPVEEIVKSKIGFCI